jgi:MYXO-CTERM domain-containing protein
MSQKAYLVVCTAFVMGCLTAVRARATVLWRGDFSTGDLSQWNATEEAATDLQVQTEVAPATAKYALDVTVHPGDIVNNGNRAEVDYTADKPAEGDDRYYHWQTMFPSDYQSASDWQIFTQWHQYNTGGSPPLAIMTWGNEVKLGNNEDVYFWTTPLPLGSWHDFIIHVTWSSSASVGGVEVWYDGQHVLPFTPAATLFPGDSVYLKQGMYRSQTVDYDQTLYHAGMTVATTLADVLPPASPPDAGAPDAGTPDAGSAVSNRDGGAWSDIDAGVAPAPGAGLVDAGAITRGGPHEETGGETSPPHHPAQSCGTGDTAWLALISAAAILTRRRRISCGRALRG